ncbi:MAG: AAA family ATPase [Desulfobacterales bacterium]
MNRNFWPPDLSLRPHRRAAARRLADVTGHPAHTIHKLLEYNFQDQRFGKDRDDPISADILIIDEFSMVDTVLMYHLMDAVPPLDHGDHGRRRPSTAAGGPGQPAQ